MAIKTTTQTIFTTSDGTQFAAPHHDADAVEAAQREAIKHEVGEVVGQPHFGSAYLYSDAIASELMASFDITPKAETAAAAAAAVETDAATATNEE